MPARPDVEERGCGLGGEDVSGKETNRAEAKKFVGKPHDPLHDPDTHSIKGETVVLLASDPYGAMDEDIAMHEDTATKVDVVVIAQETLTTAVEDVKTKPDVMLEENPMPATKRQRSALEPPVRDTPHAPSHKPHPNHTVELVPTPETQSAAPLSQDLRAKPIVSSIASFTSAVPETSRALPDHNIDASMVVASELVSTVSAPVPHPALAGSKLHVTKAFGACAQAVVALELDVLDKQKHQAVEVEDYDLAEELKQQQQELQRLLVDGVDSFLRASTLMAKELAEIRQAKLRAADAEDYDLAATLKTREQDIEFRIRLAKAAQVEDEVITIS